MRKKKPAKRFRVTQKALAIEIGGKQIGLMDRRELCNAVAKMAGKLKRVEKQAEKLALSILS